MQKNQKIKPGIIFLITMIAYGIYLLFLLTKLDMNVSKLIMLSDVFCNQCGSNVDDVFINTLNNGYDGQFYYQIARDPFLSDATNQIVVLDSPHYRHQRILYPLTVNILTKIFGLSVPIVLILVNYLTVGIIGYMGAKIAVFYGKSAWLGLLFSLSPTLLFSLSRDLVEVLELAMMISAIYWFLTKRRVLYALCISLAVLTKETALLVPIAIMVTEIIKHIRASNRESIINLIISTVPIMVFMGWKLILFRIFPNSIFTGADVIVFPFKGFIQLLQSLTFPIVDYYGPIYIELLFIFGQIAVGTFLIIKRKLVNWLGISFLLYSVLIITCSYSVWQEDWGFMRAVGELWFLFVIIFLKTTPKLNLGENTSLIFIIGLFWTYIAQNIIRYRFY
jgi:hypothetical protein